MKRTAVLLLIIAVIFSFSSCLNKGQTSEKTEPTVTTIATTKVDSEYVPTSPTAYLHNTFAAEYIEFYYCDYSEDEDITIKGWLTYEDTASVLSVLNHVDLEWIFTGEYYPEKRFFLKIGELRVRYDLLRGKLYEPYLGMECTLSENYRSCIDNLIEPYINGTKTFSPNEKYEYNEALFWADPEDVDVTLADQIKEGMTYSDVLNIIGKDGVFFPRKSENMTYSIEKYWRLSDGSYLRILLEDGSPDYTNPSDVSNMDDWVVKSIYRALLTYK